MKRISICFLTIIIAAYVQPGWSSEWGQATLNLSYGTNYHDPGVAYASGEEKDITKYTLNFTYVGGYIYGTNFFSVDMLLSDNADFANNSDFGSTEFYANYRNNISFNTITNSKIFSFGPIADVSLDFGFTLGAENSAFSASTRAPVGGINLHFDVPGRFNVALLYYKEWNNNGITGKKVQFQSTYAVESAWAFPFHMGQLPTSFEGFLAIKGPKGKDGFGEQTKTEVLFRPKLMFDVGALYGHENVVRVGFGWEYWLNKYGSDHNKVAGTEQSTLFATIEAIF